VPAPERARQSGGGAGAGEQAGQAGHGADGPITVAEIAAPEEVRALLAEGRAPEALAQRVTKTLGVGAAGLLRADPWQLLAVPGVRPDQADGFARVLLGDEAGPGDPRRTVALVGWLLERAALRGDTALAPDALAKGLAQHSVPDPDEAVREAVDAGAVLVFEDALDAGPVPSAMNESDSEEERPVHVLVGLDRYALAEESLADGLARIAGTFASGAGADEKPGVATPELTHGVGGQDGWADDAADGVGVGSVGADGVGGANSSADGVRPDDSTDGAADGVSGPDGSTDRRADAWAAAAERAASSSARELIGAAAGNGLVTHTGGEASRAEVAELVTAARQLGLRAWALTHTDDGRERMARLFAAMPADGPSGGAASEATGGTTGCATVAGVLAGAEGPGRDGTGALAVDLLAVCDAPQLDAETAAALLEALPDGVRLVLSGDPGVLGAAGPGQVFRDLMAAKFCPHVASRTPDPGPLGELVSGIGIGELNQVAAPGKEVVIVPVTEPGEAVHRTVQLVVDSVPRALSIPPAETQVIAPAHTGAAGTRALNTALKERLNPGPGRFGGFDPGDRVAYSHAPGRTSVGTVSSADDRGLRLSFGSRSVTVPPGRVPEAVRHGWAVTAHQAAGLRWPAVVVVLPGDAKATLTREWVYTAFGRGERHLSVVHGAGEALPHAVASSTGQERTTRLRTLLTEAARAAEAARATQPPTTEATGL
jgi:hypothetical protein